MILDHKSKKATKKIKSPGLNELAPGTGATEGDEQVELQDEEGRFSLLAMMKDEDAAKFLTAEQLLSFQRWRQGGGKGFRATDSRGGKTGNPGGSSGGQRSAVSTTAAGMTATGTSTSGVAAPGKGGQAGNGPFSGVCHFCNLPGHRKRDCAAFDAHMAERRRQGLAPPKGGGKGAYGGGPPTGGKGTYNLDYQFLDQAPNAWSPAGPAGQAVAPSGPPNAASGSQNFGWGGRLCAPLLRVDPRAVVEKPDFDKIYKPEVKASFIIGPETFRKQESVY